MSTHDFRSKVQQLLSIVPREPGYAIPEGVTSGRVAEFERRMNVKVPGEVREWLQLTNGPVVGPGGVFGIGTDRRDMDMESYCRLYPSWREKQWLPIAGDGSGNYYIIATGISNDNLQHPVLFIDTNDDPSEATYIVASNLWAFLYFLFERELGGRGWPFERRKVVSEDPDIESYPDFTLPWNA